MPRRLCRPPLAHPPGPRASLLRPSRLGCAARRGEPLGRLGQTGSIPSAADALPSSPLTLCPRPPRSPAPGCARGGALHPAEGAARPAAGALRPGALRQPGVHGRPQPHVCRHLQAGLARVELRRLRRAQHVPQILRQHQPQQPPGRAGAAVYHHRVHAGGRCKCRVQASRVACRPAASRAYP